MKCTDEADAFDTTPELFILFLRIAAVVGTTINLFGLYCVIVKTPSHFREYRHILTIYQLCMTYMDFHMSVLCEPVIYLPLPFVQPRGILQFQHYLKVEAIFVWTMAAMSFQICSIMAVFQYRVHAIAPPGHFLKVNSDWILKIVRILPGFIDLLCLFLGCLLVERGDPTAQIEAIKSEYYCVNQLLQDPKIETLDMGVFRMLMIFELATIGFASASAIFFITLSYSFLKSSPAISPQTIKLQRRFQKSLCAQVFGPICSTAAPAVVVTALTLSGYVGFQMLTNIFIALFSVHGAVSTVIMIGFNKHYTQFLIQLLSHIPCIKCILPKRIVPKSTVNSQQTS